MSGFFLALGVSTVIMESAGADIFTIDMQTSLHWNKSVGLSNKNPTNERGINVVCYYVRRDSFCIKSKSN